MDPMLQVALATFVTYGALYAVILPALASVLPGAAAYAKCSPAEQSEWNTRIISTLHAVVVTAGVIPPLLPGSPFWADRAAHYEDFPCYFIAIIVGYLMADLCAVLWLRKTMSSLESTVVHHVFGGLAFGLCARQRGPVFWACFFIAGEASTPFVNARWFFAKTGVAGLPYVLNGALMVLVFGGVRVLPLPYSTYLIGWRDLDALRAAYGPTFATIFWRVLVPINACLQSYWFTLIVKGALKALKGKKKV